MEELRRAGAFVREAAKVEIDSHHALERLKNFHDDINVYFLGTSASSPVQYRNGNLRAFWSCLNFSFASLVSSIFVEVPAGGILLDCGEGSLGQMYRLFGNDLDKVRLFPAARIHTEQNFS